MNLRTKPIERIRKWCKDAVENWGPVAGLITACGTVLWFFLASRIDEAAKAAVVSPEVLADISKKVRPYAVIYTSIKGDPATFKYDAGCGDRIEAVTLRKGDSRCQGILTLNMKSFAAVPPLVRPITPSIYVHSSWQTNKFDWAYEIRCAAVTVEDSGNTTTGMPQSLDEPTYTFLIELLPN